MADEETRGRREISPELRASFQTAEGRPTVAGVWATKFAEASHNLKFDEVAAGLVPDVDKGARLLSGLAEGIKQWKIPAHEDFQGQDPIQRLKNLEHAGSTSGEQIKAILEEMGVSEDDFDSVYQATQVTGELNGSLRRGNYGTPRWETEGSLDKFSLEFGGMVLAVKTKEGQLHRDKLMGGIVVGELVQAQDPPQRSFARSEPKDDSETLRIQKDAEYLARVGGALQLIEDKFTTLFFGRKDAVPGHWSEDRKRFDEALQMIKSKFLQTINVSKYELSTLLTQDNTGEKLRDKFKSELIDTGYLDQLKKGERGVNEQDRAVGGNESERTNPDQKLLTELASLDGVLQHRSAEAGKNIAALEVQIAQWRAHKGHLDTASDRLKGHQEKLSTAASFAAEAARIKELIGGDLEVRSHVSGRAVLELGAGAARELLTGMQTDQLLAVVRDPEQFTEILVGLYKVPDDQIDMLKGAVSDAAQMIRPALDMPAAGRQVLVDLVQGKLSWIADVIGAQSLEKGRSEMDRLLSSRNVEITGQDRQQIQADVASVKGLLGQS